MDSLDILISAWVFVFGLVVGSFLNVCIFRLPRDLSIVRPRSACPVCRHLIAWYDNIPVLSYFLLGRRCRHCKTAISPRYALVETLTGVLFLAVYYSCSGQWGWMVIGWALSAALIVGTFIDFEYLIIPDAITLPGILLGLVIHGVFPSLSGQAGVWQALLWSALGGLAGGGFLWLVAVVGRTLYGKDVMGMGDVKLMAMAGTILGWKAAFLSIFLGSLFGSFVGIFLVVSSRSTWKSQIPFGPYLSLGILVTFLAGKQMLYWYWKLLSLMGPH